MTKATLGGHTFRVNPTEITWDFSVKVAEHRTLGGKVIQVLGTTLGDVTVNGTFGKGGWREQKAFYEQVVRWGETADRQHSAVPLKFTYPPRGWNFNVFVKKFSNPEAGGSVRLSNEEIAPKFSLTLFVVDDSARNVATGIKDAYISRLMEGVGWKQTLFNGPEKIDLVMQEVGATSVQQYFDVVGESIVESSLNGTYTPGDVAGAVANRAGGF